MEQKREGKFTPASAGNLDSFLDRTFSLTFEAFPLLSCNTWNATYIRAGLRAKIPEALRFLAPLSPGGDHPVPGVWRFTQRFRQDSMRSVRNGTVPRSLLQAKVLLSSLSSETCRGVRRVALRSRASARPHDPEWTLPSLDSPLTNLSGALTSPFRASKMVPGILIFL